MSVGVANFSDPLEAQGLAHFLEHMLFMGSTKFPVENEHCTWLLLMVKNLDFTTKWHRREKAEHVYTSKEFLAVKAE